MASLRFAVANALLGVTCAFAQTRDDFALWLEQVGPADALVVGSWKVRHVQGWSWGVCHNPSELSIGTCTGTLPEACKSCVNVTCPEDVAAPGPAGRSPSFHSVSIFDEGIAQGVVLDFMQQWEVIGVRERFEMLRMSYTCKTSPATLAFCSTLGTPPVDTAIVINGLSYPPAIQRGLVLTCGAVPAGRFIRGDANADGRVDIADPVRVFHAIFGDETVSCDLAADANDDDKMQVADVVYLLSYLFALGPAPAAPFLRCGVDLTPGTLTCEDFAPCRSFR